MGLTTTLGPLVVLSVIAAAAVDPPPASPVVAANGLPPIAHPEAPLGTHVYTAMSVTDGGAGMRWNLMTIPTNDAAPVTEGRSNRHRGGKETPPPVRVDIKSIDQRILALGVPAGDYASLAAGPAGTVFYLETPRGGGPSPLTLHR